MLVLVSTTCTPSLAPGSHHTPRSPVSAEQTSRKEKRKLAGHDRDSGSVERKAVQKTAATHKYLSARALHTRTTPPLLVVRNSLPPIPASLPLHHHQCKPASNDRTTDRVQLRARPCPSLPSTLYRLSSSLCSARTRTSSIPHSNPAALALPLTPYTAHHQPSTPSTQPT